MRVTVCGVTICGVTVRGGIVFVRASNRWRISYDEAFSLFLFSVFVCFLFYSRMLQERPPRGVERVLYVTGAFLGNVVGNGTLKLTAKKKRDGISDPFA